MSINRLELLWYHISNRGVTNYEGKAVQHLQMMSFGEMSVNQRDNGSFDSRYKFTAKELDNQTGFTYFGERYYDSEPSIWLSVDPMAEKRSWVSPYVYCQNNPVGRVDPTGALDNPIYDLEGNFLGTDDRGLKGEAIIMNNDDFKQGMTKYEAESKGKYYSELNSIENFKFMGKGYGHWQELKYRPDYDGIVTINEGIQWAKDHPNTLPNNITPDNSLYLDASKLNFGDLSVDNIGLKQGQKGNINLFDYVHWTSSSSRAPTYALGNTQIKLLNSNTGTVKLFWDDYNWDYHNNPPSGIRDRLIQAERWRSGVNNSHGFRVFIYGTGTIKK